MEIYQMDAISAFMQGELKEDIHMNQPDVLNDGSNKVCRLEKVIYGLKQAGNVWNAKLNGVLEKMGYIKCKLDPCIFFNNKHSVIIGIYVDDLIILYTEEILLSNFKEDIQKLIDIKDIGPIKSWNEYSPGR